jgi:glycerophosphoryl diester phosphodiesterase
MHRDEDRTPQIIAHRGASNEAPENTLAAFRLAWRRGADGIEGDFRLTADGEIVCIHDRTTGRVAGEDLVVAETAYRDLRALDVGAWKGAEWTGQRIPALQEVLATIPPRGKLIMEIKSGREILPPLEAALASAGLDANQLIFISFSTEIIAETRRRFPEHKSLWIVRFEPDKPTKSEPPSLNAILRTLSSLQADGLDAQAHPAVDLAFATAIREAGFELHLWSQEEVSRLEPFARLPVDSLTCNFPGEMKAMLARGPRGPR